MFLLFANFWYTFSYFEFAFGDSKISGITGSFIGNDKKQHCFGYIFA